ncbi:MAG: YraN family protein [Gammaproteobacteria bacterium]|nr:YraN family protein [Gammaproteobacteria bacterium]
MTGTVGGDRRAAGRAAEDAALEHLRRNGLKLIKRNYLSRCGEIDLIMRDGATLVFIEVRYRARKSHGNAAETVDGRKRAKLIATAQSYLQRSRWRHACRFDVVALSADSVDWIRDAFRGD